MSKNNGRAINDNEIEQISGGAFTTANDGLLKPVDDVTGVTLSPLSTNDLNTMAELAKRYHTSTKYLTPAEVAELQKNAATEVGTYIVKQADNGTL